MDLIRIVVKKTLSINSLYGLSRFLQSEWKIKYLIPLSLIFGTLCFSQGQDKQISFRRLTVEDGLSQNSVISIAQDNLGLLWLATQEGLNRYDGINFQIFDEYFDDITKPTYSQLGKILVDPGDNIWIITTSGVLKKYSAHDLAVRTIPPVINANCMTSLHHGQMLVGTIGNGLYLLNYSNDEVSKLNLSTPLPDTIHSVAEDLHGGIWATTNTGIYHSKNLEDPWIRLRIQDTNDDIRVNPIKIGANGEVWAGSYQHGPLIKRSNDSIFYKLSHLTDTPLIDLDKLNVLSILIDSKGRVWLGTYGHGLVLVNQDLSLSIFQLVKNNPNSISYNDILCLYEDKNQVIWAGTDGGGVSYYDENLHKFNSFTNSNVAHNTPVHVIRSIVVDDQDKVWLGTSGYGLTFFDPSGTGAWYNINSNNSGLSNDRIMHLSIDYSGNLWIGTQGNGLEVFDNQAKVFTNYYQKNNPNRLPDHTIWTIEHDSNNVQWVGTREHGLYKFNRDQGVIANYDPGNSGIAGSSVIAIAKEDDNTLWLGLEKSGICKLNMDENKFTCFNEKSNTISSNLIKTLYISDHHLWIGTNGGGLNVINLQNNDSRVFKTDHGLPNNVIYAIIPDESGNLWLSTNRGICRFKPPKNPTSVENEADITSYDNYDGLQGLEFNTGASFKDTDGNIYFGGINGYSWFDPENISINHQTSKTIINSFEVNGVPHPMDTTISRKNLLKLKYNQNAISFSFSMLHFGMPHRNRYRYRLMGYHEDWVESGFRNYVNYTNLEPGDYNFQVVGANYDGILHPESSSLQIIIIPPWWKSNWAYFGYALFAVFLFWGVYHFQNYRWKLKSQLQLEQQEAEKFKELHNFKTRLYTNITHEFRTPLTVITGLIEKCKEYVNNGDSKELLSSLDTKSRNVRRLLNLVNQMMDLSKLQSDYVKNDPTTNDLISFLNTQISFYESHAESKGISLQFESALKELMFEFDPENLSKIISNLISNAIKFTNRGAVVVNLWTEIRDNILRAVISVNDTGIGIPEEDLPNVFERFYQVSNEQERLYQGSGIGLAIVKELVELMNGSIRISSEYNVGTTVFISLPVRQLEEPKLPVAELTSSKHTFDEEDHLNHLEDSKASKPIILILEDNLDLLDYLKSCFNSDYQVETSQTGTEGIRIAQEVVPDIIISDIMMPGKNGYEVCSTIKSDHRTSHILVILLSAKTETEDRIAGFKFGADSYLTKPFSSVELLTQVDTLLRNRKNLMSKFHNESNDFIQIQLQNKESSFLGNLNEIVSRELANPELNVTLICQELNMSRTQLHRKTKALTDKSITSYIRTTRLRMAKRLIANSKLTIQEIAYNTGFSDPSYFHRAFLNEFGQRPTFFRK